MATNYKSLNQMRVIFFYRVNNPDCEITRKALYENMEKHLDKIVIQEINFDQNKEICDIYHVYGVPTLLIMKEKKVLNRYSGVLNPAEIVVFLEPIIRSNRGGYSINDPVT